MANVYYIPNSAIDAKHDDDGELSKFSHEIMNYLVESGDINDIRRGDIVILESIAGYRNSGKLIFNGVTVEDLYTDIDDYGSIPPGYKVLDPLGPSYDIDHWGAIIDHNNIVFFDPEPYIDEIVNNVEELECGLARTTFFIGEKEYHIYATTIEQMIDFTSGNLEEPYFYYNLDFGVWNDEPCIDYIPESNGNHLYLSQYSK